MKRLSKEEFVKIIDDLRVESDTKNELYSIYHIDIIDCTWVKSDDAVIKLLRFIFDDTEDFISWWCWETDFGRDESLCVIYEDDSKIIVDTSEKLYDFLVSVRKSEWLS